MSAEDLIPLNRRSKEEQYSIRSKGGKASGEARRKKRDLKKILELLLSQPSNDGSNEDNYTKICVAQVKKAIAGDTKAFEVVRDTIGQKPVDKVSNELSGKTNFNIKITE